MSKFGEVGKVILDTNLWFFFLVGHDYDCKEIDFLQDAEFAPLFFESFKGEKKEIFGGFAKRLYLCLVVLEFGLFSHRNTKTSETHTKNGSVAE